MTAFNSLALDSACFYLVESYSPCRCYWMTLQEVNKNMLGRDEQVEINKIQLQSCFFGAYCSREAATPLRSLSSTSPPFNLAMRMARL